MAVEHYLLAECFPQARPQLVAQSAYGIVVDRFLSNFASDSQSDDLRDVLRPCAPAGFVIGTV
jgi:hypothetical protein